MTTFFIIVYILILSFLSVYAVIFCCIALSPLFAHRQKSKGLARFEAALNDSVAVLIPAHNEGEGLVDTIETTLHQEYAGHITLYVLLTNKNTNEAEFAALSKFYHFDIDAIEQGGEAGYVIQESKHRKVVVFATGVQYKKDKIEWILDSVHETFIAILDADHRPGSDWVSSSLGEYYTDKGGKVAGVQTRRKPLSLQSLSQILDSGQGHIGNELVNLFLSSFSIKQRSVFFTGTAAIFNGAIFKKFRLSDSITEDTFLSYSLLASGYSILYNDKASSYEEVAASFRDYVFRRRRWSAGHTSSFFAHLPKIIKADIPYIQKLILCIHGLFYLVPVSIFIAISVYGYYFLLQVGAQLQISTLLLSFGLALLLAFLFRQKNRGQYKDALVAFLFILPQVAMLAPYLYKFMGIENYFYILSFPYAGVFLHWGLLLILAPICVSVSGYIYFKDMRGYTSIVTIVSYPLVLFLDVYAALLGFVDMISGTSHWSKITRRNTYSARVVEASLIQRLQTGTRALETSRMPILFIILFLVISTISINELLAVRNCGEIKKFLWTPLFAGRESPAELEAHIQKHIVGTDRLSVQAIVTVSSKEGGHYSLRYFVEGATPSTKEITLGPGGAETVSLVLGEYPLGWEQKKLHMVLQTPSHTAQSLCSREIPFSTVTQELRGRDLYINAEKFLIKGIVPSFMNNQVPLSLEDGFKQFYDIGVNTVRVYHEAGDELRSAARTNNLRIIHQPNNSTWNEFSLDSTNETKRFLKRYKETVEGAREDPVILLSTIGNEWEFCKKGTVVSCINKTGALLEKAKREISNYPSSYATYFTFIKYPTDIAAINMLDTGATYWGEGLGRVHALEQPFYASEFGGFSAFYEELPSSLRMKRLEDEWALLLEHDSLGANFFQSHDNWAQPVVTGYNDPFSKDQPDDVRGFWDEKNKPKMELLTLRKLLSDVTVRTASSSISVQDKNVTFVVANKRDYSIHDLYISLGKESYTIGSIAPRGEQSVSIQMPGTKDNKVLLQFYYTSHHGLRGGSQVLLTLPFQESAPSVLNDDFTLFAKNKDMLRGGIVTSELLHVLLPDDWLGFSVNDKVYEKTNTHMTIAIENPFHAVRDFEVSREGVYWYKPQDLSLVRDGQYLFRFVVPKIEAENAYILLAGIGAETVEIHYKNSKKQIKTHNYREVAIAFSEIGDIQEGDTIVVSVTRTLTGYIDKKVAEGLSVATSIKSSSEVIFETPRIFAPATITIQKIK